MFSFHQPSQTFKRILFFCMMSVISFSVIAQAHDDGSAEYRKALRVGYKVITSKGMLDYNDTVWPYFRRSAMYAQGLSVPKDHDLAMRWWLRGARNGSWAAIQVFRNREGK